jgi:hypothetical protein
MGEWKLFDGDQAHVSTAEFHAHRERAPHLEQSGHRDRLLTAASFVMTAVGLGARSVSDLGCGDGGLLSLLAGQVDAWGYDFQPSNAAGWAERGVTAEQFDVFGADRDRVLLGDVTVTTEVLEHLTDPHEAVRWIATGSKFLVASSPWDERPGYSDECHAWAWDRAGYRALVEQGGYRILQHVDVTRFQVILGAKL